MYWKKFSISNYENSSKAVKYKLLQELEPGKDLWIAFLIIFNRGILIGVCSVGVSVGISIVGCHTVGEISWFSKLHKPTGKQVVLFLLIDFKRES